MNNYGYGCDGSEPYFNEPNPPECPNNKCMYQLEEDWDFCPKCGRYVHDYIQEYLYGDEGE